MSAPPGTPHRAPPETIGKRIAWLRAQHGWTQQSLASRLAISRVAISHIEMDLTLPSERTVILLAGLFKCSPHTLVAGTTYPLAKAERLPATTLQYTALELELALLERDLSWLAKLAGDTNLDRIQIQVLDTWKRRLQTYAVEELDEQENRLLAAAQEQLRALQVAPVKRKPRKG